MARVIGEAKIRLTTDGAGLGVGIRREIRAAAAKAFSDGALFKDAEKAADESSERVGRSFTNVFNRIKGLGASLGQVLASAGKIVAIGAGAGAALASVTSLTSGLLGLVAVLGQVAGVAGLLPAAFAGLLAVTATIKLGIKGIGDSFKALASGDMAKFQESLKGLAPAAREFMTSIQAVKPAFDRLQIGVQQQLFAGLGREVAGLAQRYLPLADTLFGKLANTMNRAAKEAISFAKEGETVGQVGLMVNSLNQAFSNLVPAVQPFLSALLDIGQVGSTFLPGIATSISNMATKFGDFIRESAASGQLAAFFQSALDAVKQLGQVLGNLGGIFVNVMNAASVSGGGLLNSLVEITGQIKAFTESAAGSAAITQFFTSMREVVAAILPVFLQLATVVGTTVVPIIADLAKTLGPALTPVIAALGTALQAAAPGIQALAQGFAQMLAGIAPALPAIGQLANVLGQGLGQVASALGPVLGQLATVLAGTLAKAIPPLVPVIVQLVQALGGILTAVAPLIAPIIQLVSAALGPILAIVQALIPPFTQLVQNVLKAIEPIMPVITQAFTELGAALAPLAGALGQALVQIFSAILPVIGPLVNAVLALVQAVIPLIPPIVQIIGILAPIIALFVQFQATILSFILQALTPLINIFGVVTSVIGGAMTQIYGAISTVVTQITGFFSNLLSSTQRIWGGITGSISGFVNNIRNFITNGFNNAVNAVRNAFNSIVSAISSGIGSAVSFVAGLPGRILGALGSFGSLLYNAGADLLRGLINGISSMIGNVIRKVADIGSSILGSIKGALGIASPSKEMAKIGVFIGEGLIAGIAKITPRVDGAASALARSVTDTMAAPINGAFPIRSGTGVPQASQVAGVGGSFVQNNYMQPGADVNQFARTVLKRAETDLLGVASTFSVQRQGVQAGMNDGLVSGVTL